MRDHVRLQIEGTVAKMHITNSERKNAISASMWIDIVNNCEKLFSLNKIRVVTIKGEGGNFSSGADVCDSRPENIIALHNIVEKAVMAIEKITIPVVAVLEGYVLGGRLELALACDLRIASDDCRLVIPAAKRGIGITQNNS